MDWRAAFAQNWPYKLAALALALLLWFNVTAEDERQEQPVRTRLEFEVRDSAWSPLFLPDEVTTTFQGKRGDMFALPFNQPFIRRVLDSVPDSILRVELTPSEVQFDRDLSVRATAVHPWEVVLRFEPVIGRRRPVTIDLEASPAAGYVIVGSPEVQPESVSVRGPASRIRSLSHVETAPLSLDDLKRTVTRQVPLTLPEDIPGARLMPDRVTVTLAVDSIVEREVGVQVRGVGEGSRGTVISPAVVSVRLRGAASQLANLTAGDLEAIVHIDSTVAAERSLPVEVRLPEGLSATGMSVPARVKISPAGGR
ncbi:MAG: YbbR-like domain-containing protein [Gemmatimonadota bacterium]